MTAMLSITTDYRTDSGDPVPYLERIAAAGFSHVHWCHEWNTERLYSPEEIRSITSSLDRLGLRMLDLHGSNGSVESWLADDQATRERSMVLIENRMELAAAAGSDTIVLHVPSRGYEKRPDHAKCLALFDRSFDTIVGLGRTRGVRVAIENVGDDDFSLIDRILARHGPDEAGICYDSGHGNLRQARGLDLLDSRRDRLLAVHLHDNDTTADQHRLPFAGTVDWQRLCAILAVSSYDRCVSMEVSMRSDAWQSEEVFLGRAFEAGRTLGSMLAAAYSRDG